MPASKRQNPYEARTGQKLGTGQQLNAPKKSNPAPKPFETLKKMGHTKADEAKKPAAAKEMGHTQEDEDDYEAPDAVESTQVDEEEYE